MTRSRKRSSKNKNKKVFSKKLVYITSTVLSVLLVVGTTQAVTTLGLNVSTDGTLTVNGNSTLGNASTDTVTVTAQVASSLTPSSNNARDLGAFGNAWRDAYVSSSLRLGNDSGASSTHNASALLFSGATTLDAGGTLSLNTLNNQTVSVGALLQPSTNNARDLGAFGNAWRDAYVSNSVRVGSGSGSSTLASNGNLTLGGGLFSSSTNGADLGAAGQAWRTIYASTSLVVNRVAATTTINLASQTSASGQGTCLVLRGANGTLYYVSVTSTAQGSLQISTVSCE